MCNKIMDAVWASPVGPMAARLVLLALADSMNTDGVCWPSVATLADKAGVSERRTRETLSQLVVDGIVIKRARFNNSNVYRIDVTKLPTKPPCEDRTPQSLTCKKVTSLVTPEVTPCEDRTPLEGSLEIATEMDRLLALLATPEGGAILAGGAKGWNLTPIEALKEKEKEKKSFKTRESSHDQEPQEVPVPQQDHQQESSPEELAQASQRLDEISHEIGDGDRDLFAGSQWDRFRSRQTFGDVRAPEPDEPESTSDRDRFRLSFPKIDCSDLTF